MIDLRKKHNDGVKDLIHRSCLNLLRIISISTGVYADVIPYRSVRLVCSLVGSVVESNFHLDAGKELFLFLSKNKLYKLSDTIKIFSWRFFCFWKIGFYELWFVILLVIIISELFLRRTTRSAKSTDSRLGFIRIYTQYCCLCIDV